MNLTEEKTIARTIILISQRDLEPNAPAIDADKFPVSVLASWDISDNSLADSSSLKSFDTEEGEADGDGVIESKTEELFVFTTVEGLGERDGDKLFFGEGVGVFEILGAGVGVLEIAGVGVLETEGTGVGIAEGKGVGVKLGLGLGVDDGDGVGERFSPLPDKVTSSR